MLGERLQKLRKDFGLSQKDLVQELSVSPFTISSYECNHSDPDDETKIKIAKRFGVSTDYLLGLIREPLPYERNKACIYLPDSFGEVEKHQIQDYIEFSAYRQQKSSSK